MNTHSQYNHISIAVFGLKTSTFLKKSDFWAIDTHRSVPGPIHSLEVNLLTRNLRFCIIRRFPQCLILPAGGVQLCNSENLSTLGRSFFIYTGIE